MEIKEDRKLLYASYRLCNGDEVEELVCEETLKDAIHNAKPSKLNSQITRDS